MRTVLLVSCVSLAACFGSSSVIEVTPGATDSGFSGEDAQVTTYRRWPEGGSDQRPTPAGPHVVVVVLGTWRADQLAPWGGSAAAAPTLTELAAQGTVFDTAIAQAPWSRPATTAILTGMEPDDVGMTEPAAGPNRRVLPADVPLLSQRLHQAGWSTVGATSNPNLNAIWGFDRGFDVFIEMTETVVDPASWDRTSGVEVVRRTLAEAEARTDRTRPVYLQLALTDAHAPIFPTAEDIQAAQEDGLPSTVARYRAALKRGDAALAALIEGMPGAGIEPSETVFLLVADHGEGLDYPLSHGPHHGLQLYRSAVHVPVILKGPGIAASGRIGGLTAQLDLLPTLLALLELPADGPVQLAGEDLSAAVKTGEGSASRAVVHTATRLRWADRSAAYSAELMCQVDHAEKATAQSISRGRSLGFSTGCCAWRADPACDRPEWDAQALAAVRSWREERRTRGAAVQTLKAEPNAVLQEQLRALGYTE